jgi:hypothetical protein
MRRAARALGLAAVVVVGLSACSSSAADRPRPPSATVGETPPVDLPTTPRFLVEGPEVVGFGGGTEIDPIIRTRVNNLLDKYLNNAMLVPLKNGSPVGDLSQMFAGPALERAAGPDRGALLDEGAGRLADVDVEDASAKLIALVGPNGVAVLNAGIHVAVSGQTDAGPVAVERSGELRLAPEGEAWKIVGYDIRVDRATPEALTTTTAATPTTVG